MAAAAEHLAPLGYIPFLWSPTIKADEKTLGYKVWMNIVDLLPHTCSLEELTTITSSFGLILAHSPFENVPSFERLTIAIATDKLERVPRSVSLLINGR
jgi:hypothetical protein